MGRPPFGTEGLIASVDVKLNGERYIQSGAEITFGNSGGGLYVIRDQHYLLIGVPARAPIIKIGKGGSPVSHMGYSIPIETIKEFLSKHADFIR